MFWDRFYYLCEKSNSKPNPVGEKIGIASGTINKWKNGGVPTGENLLKISNYFNVSIDYLLGLTDNINFNQNKSHQNENTLDRILYLLKEKGIQQKEFDKALNLGDDNISAWKSGKSQSYKKYIYQIASYLNVSVDYLLCLTDELQPVIKKELPQNERTFIETLNVLGVDLNTWSKKKIINLVQHAVQLDSEQNQ